MYRVASEYEVFYTTSAVLMAQWIESSLCA